MLFRALVLFLVIFALPAAAADKHAQRPAKTQAAKAKKGAQAPPGLPADLPLDPEVKKQEEAYKAAIGPLTQAQRDTLVRIEKEYTKTLAVDLQIITAEVQLKYCIDKDPATGKDQARYQSGFDALRGKLEEQQARVRDGFFSRHKGDTPFIDPEILAGHYRFMSDLTLMLGASILQENMKQGGADKIDCPHMRQMLDAAMASAAAPREGGAVPDRQLDDIRKGAAEGDAESLLSLGMLEVSGNGVDKDVKGGMELITRAAEKGYVRAEYVLGLALSTDMLGLKPDREKARQWLQKAADQGSEKARHMLEVFDAPPDDATPEELRRMAEDGDREAQYALGTHYNAGKAGVRDADEARKWLLLAASKGHARAQADLAALLLGEGKTEDGLLWMTRAAENGVAGAQYALGMVYVKGELAPRDADKAIYWLGKAAAAGDPRATDALAEMGGR